MNAAEYRYLTVVDSSRCRLEGRCLHCCKIYSEEEIRKYAEVNEDYENASFFITCFACGALADVNLIVEVRDHDGSVTYQVFEYYNQKQLFFAMHEILQRSGKQAFELKELASKESSVLWNLTYYYGGKEFLFDERLPINVSDRAMEIENQKTANEADAEVEEILERVNKLLEEEEFEAALLELNKVESLERNADALTLRGVIKYMLKQLESAVEDLNRAEKLNTQHDLTGVNILLIRAKAYMDLNKMREAYVDISLWNENTLDLFKWKEEKVRVEEELLKGHSIEEFTIMKLIDEGSFGKVHLATWNGKHVALKTPLKVSREAIVNEALTSMKFRHENIVSTLGLCNGKGDEVSIVMEYAEDGSLNHLLYKQKVKLTREQILIFARDVASGLAYLHRRSVIHRDLKSANILLFEQKTRAKIADFGQSRFLNDKSVAKTVTGTFGFIAPEVLAEKDYDEKADVYSFGVLLYEMCTSTTLPILGMEDDRMQRIDDNVKDDRFREIIKDCCKTDPEQRPTSQQCLDRIAPILEVLQKKRRLNAAREHCHAQFKGFLSVWNDLNTSLKRSVVTTFLNLKYERPDLIDTKHPFPLNTNELLPADFEFKKEFIDIAKDIVANYSTDQEKEQHWEFAPQYIRDRLPPLAQIVMDNNTSGLTPMNVLLVGDDDESKRIFAERFWPPHFVTKSIEDSKSKISAELFGYGKTFRLIDLRLSAAKDDPSLFAFLSDFIAHTLTPEIGGPIHVVLICKRDWLIESWMYKIIGFATNFAEVINVQIIDSTKDTRTNGRPTNSLSKFHALRVQDQAINGITFNEDELGYVAESIAQEAVKWTRRFTPEGKLKEDPTTSDRLLLEVPEKRSKDQSRCILS